MRVDGLAFAHGLFDADKAQRAVLPLPLAR